MAGLVAALLAATPVLAARVIDQSNLVDPALGPLTSSTIARFDLPGESPVGQAQTITAGRNGTLAAVDLQLFRPLPSPDNEDFTVSIYDGALVEGTGTLVGSFAIALGDAPNQAQAQAGSLFNLDLSSLGFAVTTGQVFTIYTSIPAAGRLYGRGPRLVNGYGSGEINGDGDPITVGLAYARGYNAIVYANGSDEETAFDRGFRTYVDVAGAVPEPGSWMMLIAGFGLTGVAMRRRALAA